MSVTLKNNNGNTISMQTSLWGYLRRMGQAYGWVPQGTMPPVGYSPDFVWYGSYESADGQIVASNDASELLCALETALERLYLNELQDDRSVHFSARRFRECFPCDPTFTLMKLIAFLRNGSFAIIEL